MIARCTEPGHVFVVQGDLTTLSCDAWLLPTDRELRVAAKWHRGLPPDLISGERLTVEPPGAWQRGEVSSFALPGEHRPAVWATDVGGGEGTSTEWYRQALASFLDQASAFPAAGRARPLLAVPVVGTGGSGGGARSGAVLAGIVQELEDAVGRNSADVVLVTNEEHAFAAAQAVRRSRAGTVALPDDLREAVSRLAALARADELVLFVGGGVSMGAGLPSWSQLMDRLATEAGLADDQRSSFSALDELDQAGIVQHRLAQSGVALGELVSRLLTAPRTSLAHALLANLPVREVVTTNYDRLFELASQCAGRRVAVLPHERTDPGGRWLLKLHGSIEHPEEIVLTREDYLRYRERRAALAGIVQALLITKHMLFVGFSLRDDNLHRIVDEVRRALRPDGDRRAEPFGTALLLHHEPLLAELWSGDVSFLAAADDDAPQAEAARRLEIALDHLLLQCSDLSSHLLDERFSHLLSPPEQRLGQALRDLGQHADQYEGTAAWERVTELLHRLGWDG